MRVGTVPPASPGSDVGDGIPIRPTRHGLLHHWQGLARGHARSLHRLAQRRRSQLRKGCRLRGPRRGGGKNYHDSQAKGR